MVYKIYINKHIDKTMYYIKKKKERKSTVTNAIFTTPYKTKKCGPKKNILSARHIFILYTIYGVKAIHRKWNGTSSYSYKVATLSFGHYHIPSV
jgi:hypothetical protein